MELDLMFWLGDNVHFREVGWSSHFAVMLERHGPPPRVIGVTLGNTSDARMREVLKASLPDALGLLRSGGVVVEIREPSSERAG